ADRRSARRSPGLARDPPGRHLPYAVPTDVCVVGLRALSARSRHRHYRGRWSPPAATLTITLVLRRLRIENLVLIRAAQLDFAPGLNAITGETGAGKTILAQAVGLLLGAKGDAAMIGPAAGEAYVEAELESAADVLDELRPDGEAGLV